MSSWLDQSGLYFGCGASLTRAPQSSISGQLPGPCGLSSLTRAGICSWVRCRAAFQAEAVLQQRRPARMEELRLLDGGRDGIFQGNTRFVDLGRDVRAVLATTGDASGRIRSRSNPDRLLHPSCHATDRSSPRLRVRPSGGRSSDAMCPSHGADRGLRPADRPYGATASRKPHESGGRG